MIKVVIMCSNYYIKVVLLLLNCINNNNDQIINFIRLNLSNIILLIIFVRV